MFSTGYVCIVPRRNHLYFIYTNMFGNYIGGEEGKNLFFLEDYVLSILRKIQNLILILILYKHIFMIWKFQLPRDKN